MYKPPMMADAGTLAAGGGNYCYGGSGAAE